MILLLQNDLAKHIAPAKSTAVPVSVITSDIGFDIDDNKDIVVTFGKGNVTYHNPNKRSIQIIAYEGFLNSLQTNLTKNIKRCDFIVHEDGGYSFFILNELSIGKVSNKRSDARLQLSSTLSLLFEIAAIKEFITKHERKECIMSIREKKDTSSPNNIALPFTNISNTLPIKKPNVVKFQPITKNGFKLLETDIICI